MNDASEVTIAMGVSRQFLSLRAGSYFDFNSMATEIWQMLAVPCRVDQIFAALGDGHDVDAQTIARDVTPFLQTLVDHRLLRVVDPGQRS